MVPPNMNGTKRILKKRILTHFDICTGCNICQLACTMVKDGGFNPDLARLDIIKSKDNLYNQPVVCNHCDNPYCMNVCPVGAITRDERGFVVIDDEVCIGCALCVRYCPLDMCTIRGQGKKDKAFKCDFCGGDPQCVRECPTGALELVEIQSAEIREGC